MKSIYSLLFMIFLVPGLGLLVVLLCFTIGGDDVDLKIVLPMMLGFFMLNMAAFFFGLKCYREHMDTTAAKKRREIRGT